MGRMTYAERIERFDARLAAAASASDADQQLAVMLMDPANDKWSQTKIAAALGDVPRGPAGSAALRSVFDHAAGNLADASKSTKPDYRDLVCASVAALAKRDGPAGTDVYVAASQSADANVRDYGMSALAVAGDDRAWDQVMIRLGDLLQRKINPRGRRWREVCRAIEYLARHADLGSDRAAQLIALLRDRWSNLADPDLIARWWPGIGPADSPTDAVDLGGQHTPLLWWRESYM